MFDFVVMGVVNFFEKCLKLMSKFSVSAFKNTTLCQHPFWSLQTSSMAQYLQISRKKKYVRRNGSNKWTTQTISFIFPHNFKNSRIESIHLCTCISKQRTHSMKISLKLLIVMTENISGMLHSQSNTNFYFHRNKPTCMCCLQKWWNEGEVEIAKVIFHRRLEFHTSWSHIHISCYERV